jgi:hypothetical protein
MKKILIILFLLLSSSSIFAAPLGTGRGDQIASLNITSTLNVANAFRIYSNPSGNTTVFVSGNFTTFNISGNIIPQLNPSGNPMCNFGSASNYWANGYVATINTNTMNVNYIPTINGLIATISTLNVIKILPTNAVSNIGSSNALFNNAYINYMFSSQTTLSGDKNIKLTINADATTNHNINGIFFSDTSTSNKSSITASNGDLFISPINNKGIYINSSYATSGGALYLSAPYGFLTSTNPSDRRLKSKIKKIPDGQLQKIMKIVPSTFIKDEKSDSGVIAQDLIKIYPNLGTKNSDGYYGVYSDRIIYYFIKAFQEYVIKTDKKINDLEYRLKKLKEAE